MASPPHPPGRVNSSGQVQGLDKCCKLLPVLKLCFPTLDFSLLLIRCICASYPLIIGAALLGFPFWEVCECARSCASPVPAFRGCGMRMWGAGSGCGMTDAGCDPCSFPSPCSCSTAELGVHRGDSGQHPRRDWCCPPRLQSPLFLFISASKQVLKAFTPPSFLRGTVRLSPETSPPKATSAFLGISARI